VTPRFVPAATLALSVLAGLSTIGARQTTETGTVAVQLLAFNDFHGNLEPPSGSNGMVGSTEAGGAEYLATHLASLRAGKPNTLTVSAGDTIGGTPLLSSMFHDEPAVEALNAMGLDVSGVGNHEFDDGWRELLRIQGGGCHPVDGCQDGTPFAGAKYLYLGANVQFDRRVPDHPGPLLPAYTIKDVGGVRIGFIGLGLKATPQLVMPSGVEGLKFIAEAEAANKVVPILKRQRVKAIVALIHEGGFPSADDYNGCPGVSGPIVEIARRMSDDIDVIVSGHTHRAYNCTIDGKLVTSAASFGRVITVIDIGIDRRTTDVVSKVARNIIVTRDVPRDPAQTAIIEQYRPLYSTVAEKVVGTLTRDITRTLTPSGESALGNLVADGTLEAARASQSADTAVAFMNPGGLRADLTHGGASTDPPRPITYAEASNVLPFRNRIVVLTLTGQMIKDVLEQQFDNGSPGQDRILQVSKGFAYSYDRTAPASRRVDPASMMIDGRRVDLKQRYRVAINEFIAAGGDNFTAFTRGSDTATIGMDLDVFRVYLEKHSPVEPGPMNRVTRLK